MIKSSLSLCASITLTGLITGPASAGVITVAGTAESSTFSPERYTADATVDGSGLSGNEHNTEVLNGWASDGATGDPIAEEWIEWDLGGSFQLDSVHVWNSNMNVPVYGGSFAGNGINQVDIYVSNVADPGDPEGAGAGNWTLWAEDANLTAATGTDDYTGFDLETVVGATLPTTAVRWVRFEVDSIFTSPEPNAEYESHVGLSEIQFTAVPEPSAFALGLVALMFAGVRRRR